MIIGKTRRGLENVEPKVNLTKEKYFYLSHLCMVFLIKNKIKELPVSLNQIVKNNKWRTIPYSKLKILNIKQYNSLMKDNLGFAELRNDEYFIYYDDKIEIEIQRFTVAHEIGHIVLNHFKIFSGTREQEANMFAARLLMPICVLYECKVSKPEEIMELCDVSLTSAKYRFERLQMLKQRNKFYTDKKERVVYKNFKSYIKQIKKKKITLNK